MGPESPNSISVAFACVSCGSRLRAECERLAQSGPPTFYDVDCPICGTEIRPFLPGPVLTLAGDQEDAD